MNIALFYNPSKANGKEIAQDICSFLKDHNVQVFAEDAVAKSLNAENFSSVSLKDIDFSFCLGGDGSILRLLHRHPELEAPIFGINMGSLGFLADTQLDELFPTLEAFLEGKYTIQKRTMMDGETSQGKRCFAVNEMVIHRARTPCLIDLAIYVDDKYLNTFSADGVIVSTATGSTAYSLSAGGPILTPDLDVFIITPINPHTISNKPIVLMPKTDIRIEYTSDYPPIDIIFDGFPDLSLSSGESFRITRSKRSFRIVNMLHHDYFATLRTKLGWTGKLKTQ